MMTFFDTAAPASASMHRLNLVIHPPSLWAFATFCVLSWKSAVALVATPSRLRAYPGEAARRPSRGLGTILCPLGAVTRLFPIAMQDRNPPSNTAMRGGYPPVRSESAALLRALPWGHAIIHVRKADPGGGSFPGSERKAAGGCASVRPSAVARGTRGPPGTERWRMLRQVRHAHRRQAQHRRT